MLKGITMAKASRKTFNIQDHPGPGRYTVTTNSFENSKKGVKFGVRVKQKLNQTLPGPADYTNLTPKLIRGGKIGTCKRIIGLNQSMDPSSQSYTPQFDVIKRKTPRYSFPSSRKKKKIEDSPGPCQPYRDDRASSATPKPVPTFGKGSKLNLIVNESPGPNKYNPSQTSVLTCKPSFSFMKERRDSDSPEKKNIPGPGAYNYIIKKAVNGILFTKASRKIGLNNSMETPGPGAYDLRPKLDEGKKKKNTKVLKKLRNMF
jgi:hypothetical protein